MTVYEMVRKYGWESVIILNSIPNVRYNSNVFFVDSGHTNALDAADESEHGSGWELPFATLNYAISRCTADQNDVILLAPGHAETLSTTATASGTTITEVGVDKAGVSILGLGTASLRPTFTLSAVAGQIAVLAANVTIENILMVSDIEDLTDMVTLDASSDGATLKNCEFRDGGASKEVIAMVDIATTVDDVAIEGCRFFSTDTNSAGLAAIRFVGTGARAVIKDCFMRGDFNTAAIEASAGQLTDVLIKDNDINNIDAAAGLAVNLKSDATGAVVRNLVFGGLDTSAPIVAAACMACENYATTIETESGNLCPAAGDWAS
ncbi:hypothetical protein LCGC14_0588610 [marine sediment metagenome]|uniref:Right handed beta helix domain-containing protein n=1 Tax=marine sediment metagenome TaxID=412755 RepID=A0A0F9RY29_9ZZZZ